ncbi:hypothetical protein BCR43DRAFT_438315 [Syncephalastrum racemosum]|uniref:Uncharacterized protein n=1 Tax=Syncephalastrum racemosum TaxID=13706 RepID=A0A1X2HGN8_SYNRA|nr:hypothetical protein BCR43DRAFT_438315 [Syncephalastrum racemosum]
MADAAPLPTKAWEVSLPALNDLDVEHDLGSEIRASYVHPPMQSLLAVHDPSKLGKWCVIVNFRKPENTSRPDYMVDVYSKYQRQYTSCLGEVKGDTTSSTSAAFDFYRLALFSKQ